MAFISEWLNTQMQAKAADMIIDDTVSNLQRREGLLDMVIPLKTYDSRHFLAYVMEELNTIASVIGYGAEPPLTQQGTFRKITAELLKFGLSRVYDEEYQWQMKEAMEEAALKGVYVQSYRDPRTGKVVPGINNSLAQYIFGTIEGLAKSQIELLDKMTWQVLQTGKISHFDSRTKVPVDISYINPYATYNHFPSPLMGGDKWDQKATANGLQNIYDAVDTYVDTNGFAPKMIVMSRKALNHLMQQQSTKEAATQIKGSAVGTVGPDLLGAALEARQLPSIVTFDEMYKYEAEDKSTSNVRFLNDNHMVFMAEEMGQRAMGPTLEGKGVQGVYVVTREITKFPPVDASQSVCTSVPIFANPKLLYAQQVY